MSEPVISAKNVNLVFETTDDTIEALKNGRDDISDMLRSYQKRRHFFVNGMNDLGLTTIMPQGAFYCFSDVSSLGIDALTFSKQLLKDEIENVFWNGNFVDSHEFAILANSFCKESDYEHDSEMIE